MIVIKRGTRMSCCTPPRDGSFKPLQFDAKSAEDQSDIEAINVPGGSVNVGTKAPQIPDDGEGPLRSLTIKPFRIAVTTVLWPFSTVTKSISGADNTDRMSGRVFPKAVPL